MSFLELFKQYSWSQIGEEIYSVSAQEVESTLAKTGPRNWRDFLVLVSPAAQPFLETMARASQKITQSRFGRTVQLYVPMYLSNKCHNVCRYCGFSANNKIKRISLKPQQILNEALFLKNLGHHHLLVVTGETKKVGVDYIASALDVLTPLFANVSIETQPFEIRDYQVLRNNGLYGVYLYQETYNKSRYRNHHISGAKADFEHRLLTQDTIGKAGVNKMGLGVLLGLEDWRIDSCFLALHLSYLQRTYWKSQYSISFPRLCGAQGSSFDSSVSDRDLVQLICAFRIFNEFVDLNLSTREGELFRDHAIHLGITALSSDSRTSPGAYTLGEQLEQFAVSDKRDSTELASSLRNQGFEVVWKDWDSAINTKGYCV